MRLKILALTLALLSPIPAHALSCAGPAPDYFPANELIAKARVVEIAKPWFGDDQIVSFEILDVYKGDVASNSVIKVKFSHFMQTWGPQLKPDIVGEYLFDHQKGSWVFSGPGGCTYVSDELWKKLRAQAKSAQPE